jgi:hypothetical protein
MTPAVSKKSAGSWPGCWAAKPELESNFLLVDRTHRNWIYATSAAGLASLGLYAFLSWPAPERLAANSVAGMWFGVFALALMVYAALLSVHRCVPSWTWLGSRKVWLRGHLWLGLLCGVLVLCHSGFRWGGTLEKVLWVLLAIVFGTGVLGLVMQRVLPRLLTSEVPCETPYEQIPNVCSVIRGKADALYESIRAKSDAVSGEWTANFQTVYEKDIRPLLAPVFPRSKLLATPGELENAFDELAAWPGLASQGEINKLKTLCLERLKLALQERLHFWLHGWLIFHVPFSAALLILSVAHAVMSLYY